MNAKRLMTIGLVVCVVLGMGRAAQAALLAYDDFAASSGFTGSWTNSPTNTSATPLPNGLSAPYLAFGSGDSLRALATPLLPATTPEFWVGLYMRPDQWNSWQFGMELQNAGNSQGAQTGETYNQRFLSLARQNAESRMQFSDAFTLGQPFFVAMRIYKNSPGDTLWNRAELWADMNGNDGRANLLQLKTTNFDLGNKSMGDFARVRLLSGDGGMTSFDYVAVGTTQADVTNPQLATEDIPEPATMALLGLAAAGLGGYLRRRRAAHAAAWLGLTLVAGVLGMGTAAQGALLAYDDFAGSSGFVGSWTNTTTYVSTTPFPDNLSAMYKVHSGGESKRALAAPLLPATTPEFWVGLYLRPDAWSSWQFGMELQNAANSQGAQCGQTYGDQHLSLARFNAENRMAFSDTFALNQPFFVALHLYKNSPTDTQYNRAELYADMNGNDGRTNLLQLKASNFDLGNRSMDNFTTVRLLADSTTDFDYVAVGTTQGDVTNPQLATEDIPEPATMALVGLAAAGLGGYLRRRRAAHAAAWLGLALVAAVLGTGSAQAAIIQASTVTGNQATSSGTSYNNIINSSGLSTSVTDANYATVTHATGFSAGIQFLTDATTVDYVFHFNTPATFNQMLLWNFTQSNRLDRGCKDWAIQVDTGSGYGGSIATGTLTPPNFSNHVADILSLPQVTGAVNLRFQSLTKFGGSDGTGLDEVLFRQGVTQSAEDIPEPATMALLGLAAAGLGGYIRRRRQENTRIIMNAASKMWIGLGVACLLLAVGAADGAIVQLGSYGLGEPGSVGASSPFTPLVDSIAPANNITGFQDAGGPRTIVTTGLGAPGSTAALQLVQNSGRNTGWHSTSPSYGLTNDWALQLWFKTPDSTSASDSFIFVGTNGNAANQNLSLELNNGKVNVLKGTDTSTRMTGFGYTTNQWFWATLIAYNGQLTLYQDTSATPAGSSASLPTYLGDIRLGFGEMAPGNRGASGTFDEMKVWSFDHAADSLSDVRRAVGLNEPLGQDIPEPATMGLVVFGLAGLARYARRRRTA